MLDMHITFSGLYGKIMQATKGEDGDSLKYTVAVSVWTALPIDPNWVGAKATKENPFVMVSRGDSDIPRAQIKDLLSQAHANYDADWADESVDRFSVRREATAGNLHAAFYELCTLVGGACGHMGTQVGEIGVVIAADSPEAAREAQQRVCEYLRGEFNSRALWTQTTL